MLNNLSGLYSLPLSKFFNSTNEEKIKSFVENKKNILICGADGVGKLTLLNSLSFYIPIECREKRTSNKELFVNNTLSFINQSGSFCKGSITTIFSENDDIDRVFKRLYVNSLMGGGFSDRPFTDFIKLASRSIDVIVFLSIKKNSLISSIIEIDNNDL